MNHNAQAVTGQGGRCLRLRSTELVREPVPSAESQVRSVSRSCMDGGSMAPALALALPLGKSPACTATPIRERFPGQAQSVRDRKSTRLNSSHVEISYAVFCLKKKKNPLHHQMIERE